MANGEGRTLFATRTVFRGKVKTKTTPYGANRVLKIQKVIKRRRKKVYFTDTSESITAVTINTNERGNCIEHLQFSLFVLYNPTVFFNG